MDSLYSNLLHIVEANLRALSGAGAITDHLIAYRKGDTGLCIFARGNRVTKGCRHSHVFDLDKKFLSPSAATKAKQAGVFDQQFVALHWAAVAAVVAQWDADARQESWTPQAPSLADMLAAVPAGPLARLCPSHLAAYDRAMAKAIRPSHRRASALAQINIDVRDKVILMAAEMESRGVLTHAKLEFPWRDGHRFFRVASSHFHSGPGRILGLSWLDTESGAPENLSLDAFPIPSGPFQLMVCRAQIALGGREAFVERAAAKIIAQLLQADEDFRSSRGIAIPAPLLAERENAELRQAVAELPAALPRRPRSL